VMQRWWGASPAAALLGTALALVTCSFRLEPRPDTISQGLLALAIGLVAAPLPFRRAVWMFPCLLALWVNLHGYFVNGLLVLAAAAVATALNDRDLIADRRSPIDLRGRLLILGGALLACFLHPQGWHATVSPLSQLLLVDSDPAFRAAIQELQPSSALFADAGAVRVALLAAELLGAIALTFTRAADRPLIRQSVAFVAALPWLVWAPPGLSALSYRVSMALLVMAAFEVPVALRDRRYFRPALLAGFTALALPVLRNVPLITPAALVLLSPAWTAAAREAVRAHPKVGRQTIGSLVVVGVVFFILWLRLADRIDTDVRAPSRTGWGVDTERFPAGAADYVASNGSSGPLLNNFDSGGYLLYRLHPAHKVFIAGNTSMYPLSFLAYYRAAVSGSAIDLDDITRRYAPSSAVLDFTSAAAERLATALALSGTWRLTFFDRNGAVFVRSNDPSTLDVAARARELMSGGTVAPALPPWLGGRRLAYPSFNFARFLSAIGRPDLALEESQRLWPVTKAEDVAVLGGKAARDSGLLLEYLPVLEEAALLYPNSEATQTLFFVALAFRADRSLNTGALAAAEEDLHRMISLQPHNCGPYFALAKAAALRRDSAEAKRLIVEGRSYDRDGICVRTAAADPVLAAVLQR
jgi:hypothetical protein